MRVAGRVFVACSVVLVMISRPVVMSQSMPMGRRGRLVMAQLHAKRGIDPGHSLQRDQQGHRKSNKHPDELCAHGENSTAPG